MVGDSLNNQMECSSPAITFFLCQNIQVEGNDIFHIQGNFEANYLIINNLDVFLQLLQTSIRYCFSFST